MPVRTWASNLEFTPAQELVPRAVDEVVEAVRQAERTNRRVRAIGSAWSFTDVLHTDDVLIRTSELKAIHAFAQGATVWGPSPEVFRGLRPEVIATERRFVHFQSGLTVKELYTALDTPGTSGRGRWALLTQGASSGQTVVGAIATGTHGADHGQPPLAGMVRAIHLVGPGGEHHWFERESGFRRITDRSGPLAAITGLREENIHYDDERFRAAVVGLGSLGVVVSVIVEARDQYGLSQRRVPIRWSAIKQAFRSGLLFNHDVIRRVPDRHPATTAGGMRVNSTPAALEIFLNPYRTDDNYSSGAGPSDRNCLVVERRQAIALDGRTPAFDPPFAPPSGGVDELGLILDVEVHGSDRYRTRIDEVMRSARAETTGYPVAHSVLDTYDGTGDALPALAIEIAVPTTDDRWIRLIDWMLFNFDLLVRDGKKFAGFMSLRFSRLSDELLGMQNFEGSPRDMACHIEIFALKEINVAGLAAAEIFGAIFSGGWSLLHGTGAEPDVDHSGNFEGASDDFVKTFEDSLPLVGARMHWGQLHRLDRADVEEAYRLTLPTWKRVRTELAAGGARKTFSNGFTERCGLESNQEVLAATSWGANRYDLFTYDELGNVLQLWWNGRWNWSNLGNHFPGGQRFVGPLTATSWGPNRIDVFGLGRDGQLLQLWWNGRWNWSNLSSPLPTARFLGPITATSWGEGRLDVFGLAPSGTVQQVWFDRVWRAANLGNHFARGQRFSGSISAASWGPNRIDIFGLGIGKQLLQLWWDGRWHWSALLGALPGRQRFSGPPAASSWGEGHLDLVGLGSKNDLLHVWWAPGWRVDHLGNGFSGEVTRLVMPDEVSDAYYRFESRRMKPMFVGPIAGASWGEGRIDYFGFDRDGRVRQLWYDAGWHWADLGRSWRE